MRHTNIPASYLVLMEGDNVLLLRRANTGYEDGNYSLVAGHLEPGETFTECIIREAKEEANITIDNEDVSVVHVLHRKTNATNNNELIDMFFVATNWCGQIFNNEPAKCDDLSWFHIDKLPNNLIPYIRHVLSMVRNGIFYSEYGWR